jgi:soluble lytic murein transglycosylase
MWKAMLSRLQYRTRVRALSFLLAAALNAAAGLVSPAQAAPAPAARRAPEAPSADEALLAVRDAAQRGDLERAWFYAPATTGHLLAAYAEYWTLRARLVDARLPPPSDVELQDFAARNTGSYVVERLRNDWLLYAGKQRDWRNFDMQYERWVFKDDPQVECYALLSRRLKGEDVRVAAKAAIQAANGGDGCYALADQLIADGAWKTADVAELGRRMMEAGNVPAVRRYAPYTMPPTDLRNLDAAMDNPARWITRNAGAGHREIAVLAAIRAIRSDPQASCPLVDQHLVRRLQPPEVAELRAQCGLHGARRLMPEALAWYREAGTAPLSDEGYAWAVRAALRGGTTGRTDWALVRSAVERMPPPLRRDPTWVYWWARALRALGQEEEGRGALQSIAGQAHFYGQLAGEDLGRLTTVPPRAPAPSAEELAAVRALPGVQRALKFYELDLRNEGHREWNYAMRGLSDRMLLAAAEYARQQELFDRTVNTADRTRVEHDFGARFITPFRDLVTAKSAAVGVDPAWVYGLIRQESRFVLAARSHVGASGLMQIMPATARWVARKVGLTNFQPGHVTQMDTNITLGTAYLKLVLDDLDGSPLLASAAYNAGPGRPKSWRASLARPVEGAIFAETIPFNETRDYVKKVLSNATFYSALMTGQPQSLKARLGQVSPKTAVASDLP